MEHSVILNATLNNMIVYWDAVGERLTNICNKYSCFTYTFMTRRPLLPLDWNSRKGHFGRKERASSLSSKVKFMWQLLDWLWASCFFRILLRCTLWCLQDGLTKFDQLLFFCILNVCQGSIWECQGRKKFIPVFPSNKQFKLLKRFEAFFCFVPK